MTRYLLTWKLGEEYLYGEYATTGGLLAFDREEAIETFIQWLDDDNKKGFEVKKVHED